MKWPKTIEDSYVLMKDGEECPWTELQEPKTRERSGWIKRPEGVCRVF